MIAVSESTPGPIMVNMATYIGSDQAGFWGSLIATVGVVLPAYLVILLVIGILKNAVRNKYVQAVLRGLKPCVTGIVLATGLSMVLRGSLPLEGGSWYIPGSVITVILLILPPVFHKTTKKPLSPILLICISAVLGIIFYSL